MSFVKLGEISRWQWTEGLTLRKFLRFVFTELNTGMSIEDMKKASVTVLKKDDEILPSHKVGWL